MLMIGRMGCQEVRLDWKIHFCEIPTAHSYTTSDYYQVYSQPDLLRRCYLGVSRVRFENIQVWIC